MTPNSFTAKEIDKLNHAVIVEEQDLDSDGDGHLALFVVFMGQIIDERLLTDKNRIIESIQRVYSKYPNCRDKWLTRLTNERIRYLAYDHSVLTSNTPRSLSVLV